MVALRLILLRRRPLHYAKGDSAGRPCLVGRRLPVDQPIVFRVIANPKPEQTICDVDRQCAILQTHTGRSESANLLEMQRRMRWIFLDKRKVLVRQHSNVGRQCVVALPETRAGEVVHILVDLPA